MGVTLRDFTEAKLYPIAVLISLDQSQLHITPGSNKAAPSNEWLADQYRRVPGLPQSLLVPPILPTGASIRASQMVKRVLMAASGGADAVAAKAAANGIPLNDLLQPHSTPTVLCHAHKKLHPTLIREIFHYITKEVADYADPIRRHPRHVHPGGAESANCQLEEVRDWSYRMMGLSALWSTRQTFRCLEKGRQAPAPGHAASKSKSSHHHHHHHHKSKSESRSHSHSHSSRRVRSHMRMPHMKFPCEACIMAIIGTRSQALIDLRAGMLSRVCAENADGLLCKDKKSKSSSSGRRHHHNASSSDASDATTASSSSFKPKSFPHLWALLDVYINAFGPEDADEIRSRSEKLAMTLLMVRICETKRRRDQRDDDRESRRHRSRSHRSHSHSHSHTHRHRDEEESASVPTFVRVKQPPRMVTKHGHRLPLPLLPPKLDPWSKHESEGEAVAETEGPVEDNYEGYADGYIDADGAFYAAQDLEESAMAGGTNEDGEAEYFYVAPDNEDDEDDGDHSAFLMDERCDLAAAMQGSVPAWESDYQHHIIDTQSEVAFSAAPAPPAPQASSRMQSFMSVSVHTETDSTSDSEARGGPFQYDYGSFGRYGPAAQSYLADDQVSEVSIASARSSQVSQSTVRSPYARPSNPEPPSLRSSMASSHTTRRTISSLAPVTRKPVPSTPTTPVARKPVPSRASLSVPRKPVPAAPRSPLARKPVPVPKSPLTRKPEPVPSTSGSPMARKPVPATASMRPPSSLYSCASMSSSRPTSRLASTPSTSTNRTSTTASSSRRAPSSATGASAASASTIKASSTSKRLPATPSSSSSVFSRLSRPTQSSAHRQSAASTKFVAPSHRRPSAPESYVAMQNSMPSAYASGHASRQSKTASTLTVKAKASGSRASEVSTASTLSSLYSGYAGNGISDEIYNARDPDADSVVPDDSISVVLTQRFLDHEQALWEEKQCVNQGEGEGDGNETIRSEEEILWLQNLQRYADPDYPMPDFASGSSRTSSLRVSKMAPSALPPPLFSEASSVASTQRNLNHYEPSIKRRPVGASSSRAAEASPSKPSSRSKESSSKPSSSSKFSSSKPSSSKPSSSKSSSKPSSSKSSSSSKDLPKLPRERHRNQSGLSNRSNLTEWPPVAWR